MRDLRLSFWSSVYGCIGLILILSSRILSQYLITHPVRSVFFLDPLNYLLTLGCIIFILRATALAAESIKKLRRGKKLLQAIQIILFFDLLFQLSAQVLHFTLNVDITKNTVVTILSILTSLPSVCGLYALYFSKQLRSRVQYVALGFFIATVFWNVLRLGDKVLIPVLQKSSISKKGFVDVLQTVCAINDELSFILFVFFLIGLLIYAYYCGKAVRKMPEKPE